MRKLAMAGALAAAALSWAQGARAADDAAKERREAADATKSEVRQEGRETQKEMKQEAREAQQEMRQGTARAKEAAREGEKKHPLFEGKNNFDVEGKLQKVSANSVTIQRDELPAATLRLSANTKIELDGEKVSASQLKPGQDVKASFNLNGDKIEAVEVKADKTGAQKEMEKK